MEDLRVRGGMKERGDEKESGRKKDEKPLSLSLRGGGTQLGSPQ